MTMTHAVRLDEPMHRLEPYRRELTQHAARVLGSRFEAEDAAQEAILRAWNALDRFDGRSQLRTWLYRICTNVCIDMLGSRQRRAMTGPEASAPDRVTVAAAASVPGAESHPDPADVAVARESVRLVLATVLQTLPPRQRAVLMLREVLYWRASETAQLLGTSVASVNSALQRARATLRANAATRDPDRSVEVDDETRWRLDRYASALAASDVQALAELVAQEAT